MKPLTDLISEVQDVEAEAEAHENMGWQMEPYIEFTLASAFKKGAASQSPIADALREAIKALELIKNSPEWKSTTTSGDEIYHTYSATSISVASEFSGKIRAILEGKE